MAETVASLLAGHRSGQISIADTVSRTFRRLREANDPAIFISVRDEAAVQEEARALSARDPATLPLYGIPIAVKDNIDVAGLPTTAGAPALKANAAQRHADAVQRLVDAGAVIFGKTNVPLFAGDLQSYNDVYGTTNNPWDTSRGPGGSSGGSAAALAGGVTRLELGSDIGGLSRDPADFWGF